MGVSNDLKVLRVKHGTNCKQTMRTFMLLRRIRELKSNKEVKEEQ